MAGRQNSVAILSLFTGATVWGLIWYPYRMLESGGLGGAGTVTLTYVIALCLGVLFLRPVRTDARTSAWLVAVALASGGCNLGYVLAMLHGEVMRVLLLFYLSPLWTVLLSRLLLGERLNRAGVLTIGLSLAGAVVMLWHPELGLPWPQAGAEWVGLGAGFLFALTNVLVRKTAGVSLETKTLGVFFGTTLVGLAITALGPPVSFAAMQPAHWVVAALTGGVLLAVNLVVFYGLARMPANRAIVIFISELAVAALGAWWLAGETMGAREWLGGALIVSASLLSVASSGSDDIFPSGGSIANDIANKGTR